MKIEDINITYDQLDKIIAECNPSVLVPIAKLDDLTDDTFFIWSRPDINTETGAPNGYNSYVIFKVGRPLPQQESSDVLLTFNEGRIVFRYDTDPDFTYGVEDELSWSENRLQDYKKIVDAQLINDINKVYEKKKH